MVFSFSICFPRSKISFFISCYCFIISSLSSCLMKFMFLLRSSICGEQLLDNSMDSVNWRFLGGRSKISWKRVFRWKDLWIVFPVWSFALMPSFLQRGRVCSPISLVSFPESFLLFLTQKKQQPPPPPQKLRISTQFASLQIWECQWEFSGSCYLVSKILKRPRMQALLGLSVWIKNLQVPFFPWLLVSEIC